MTRLPSSTGSSSKEPKYNDLEGTMKKDKRIQNWVSSYLNIDASKLSDADVLKVAKHILRVMALETPGLAEIHRKELGL